MKLSQLKKDLKQVGVDFAEVKREIEKYGADAVSIIQGSVTSDGVLMRGFKWRNTERGIYYWGNKHSRLLALSALAPEGKVCDYAVYKSGSVLTVGCQTITPRQQKALFKLLADHLGYEIQE